MLRIKSPQDVGAALIFILIGAAGIYFGKDLRFGTASRMGPGYFPYYLSWCIVGLGLIIGSRALVLDGPAIARPQLRPLLMIVIAILFFGYVIEYFGLVVATIGLVVIAAYARTIVNLKETLLLAVGMTAFIFVVFVWALHQPLPLWGY
jgi:hypothetical protein